MTKSYTVCNCSIGHHECREKIVENSGVLNLFFPLLNKYLIFIFLHIWMNGFFFHVTFKWSHQMMKAFLCNSQLEPELLQSLDKVAEIGLQSGERKKRWVTREQTELRRRFYLIYVWFSFPLWLLSVSSQDWMPAVGDTIDIQDEKIQSKTIKFFFHCDMWFLILAPCRLSYTAAVHERLSVIALV